MTAFSNIARQAVLPLGAYKLDALMRDAERSDQRVLKCDFDGAHSEQDVLKTLAGAFGLNGSGAQSLDALGRSMTALTPLDADQPGFVVILQNLPNCADFGSQERDALLDVFRDAADFFYDRDTAFRVFYSVAPRS